MLVLACCSPCFAANFSAQTPVATGLGSLQLGCSCRAKRTKFANGFEVTEVATGPNPKAPMANPGKRVSVLYTGTLQSNGKVFDKTKGNKPFSFRLGALLAIMSGTLCMPYQARPPLAPLHSSKSAANWQT
jgi:FKBP-type peptidyl-prolyl cis-trans isomerase